PMSGVKGIEESYIDEAITAFQNLTYTFIQSTLKGSPSKIKKHIRNVRFDFVALTSMLLRFQRDTFGVNRFEKYLESRVKLNKLDSDTAAEIFGQVCSLGLRITAESPRKTRVAAVFTFWMCVLRPVSFNSKELAK